MNKGEPTANFRGHTDRVFHAVWNPLNSDEIFSGGEDLTLQCWKISEQYETKPPSKGTCILFAIIFLGFLLSPLHNLIINDSTVPH